MPTTSAPPQEPQSVDERATPADHQTVLAEAVRDDSEHYDDPLLATS